MEKGTGGTGGGAHFGAFSCFRAHLGRREGVRRGRGGRGGQDGERTWAHFRDLGRIWDGEKGTGGGEGDRRTGGEAHVGAFSRFWNYLGHKCALWGMCPRHSCANYFDC